MADKTPIKLHLIEPRATEKAYFEQTRRTYIFEFGRDFKKQAIADLVAKEFSVTVTDVRVLNRKGKKTRYSKGKHQYPGTTYRKDKKLAYVTLKEGDKIKVFDEPEEDKKSSKKKETSEKKLSKSALASRLASRDASARKDGPEAEQADAKVSSRKSRSSKEDK